MSGSGCRDYERFLTMNQETWFDFLERVCQYNVNFLRIDLAIDDRKTYLSISELIRLKNEGLISSQLRDISENCSDKLMEDNIESNGKSLYIGIKNSGFRIIFYEKGYEQAEKFGKELDTNWNRYELRFRKKKAVKLVQELLKDRNVARVAMSVLNDKVRFLQKPEYSSIARKRLYPNYPSWKEFMQSILKIKLSMDSVPIDNYLQKNREWLIKNVVPSVKMQMIWDKMNNNKNDIFTEMSHARLSEKQKSALQTIEKYYELENYI